MYCDDMVVTRLNDFSTKLKQWKESFKALDIHNSMDQVQTEEFANNVQYFINNWIETNNIGIKLSVVLTTSCLTIIGQTLNDQIIFNKITEGVI